MSRKLSIGKPKHEGPYQDFPLVRIKGSISDWVETLPVVEDYNLDYIDNNYVDLEKR